jgi:hypothetical protein
MQAALVGALTDWEKNLQAIAALAEGSSNNQHRHPHSPPSSSSSASSTAGSTSLSGLSVTLGAGPSSSPGSSSAPGSSSSLASGSAPASCPKHPSCFGHKKAASSATSSSSSSAIAGALASAEGMVSDILSMIDTSVSTGNSSVTIQPSLTSADLAVVEYDFTLNAAGNTSGAPTLPNNSLHGKLANPIAGISLGSSYNYNTGLLRLAFNPNNLASIPNAITTTNANSPVIIGSIMFALPTLANDAVVTLTAANAAALDSDIMQYLYAVPIYETADRNGYINGFNIVLSPAGINAFMLATGAAGATAQPSAAATAAAAAMAEATSAASAASAAAAAASAASTAATAASTAASAAASGSVEIAAAAATGASLGIVDNVITSAASAIMNAVTGVIGVIRSDASNANLATAGATAASTFPSTGASAASGSAFLSAASSTASSSMYHSYELDAANIIAAAIAAAISANEALPAVSATLASGSSGSTPSADTVASAAAAIIQYVCDCIPGGVQAAINDANTAITNGTMSKGASDPTYITAFSQAITDTIAGITGTINTGLSASSPTADALAAYNATLALIAAGVTGTGAGTAPTLVNSIPSSGIAAATATILSMANPANSTGVQGVSFIYDIATQIVLSVWTAAGDALGAAQVAFTAGNGAATGSTSGSSTGSTSGSSTGSTSGSSTGSTSGSSTGSTSGSSTGSATSSPTYILPSSVLVSYDVSYFTSATSSCAVPAPSSGSGYNYLSGLTSGIVNGAVMPFPLELGPAPAPAPASCCSHKHC